MRLSLHHFNASLLLAAGMSLATLSGCNDSRSHSESFHPAAASQAIFPASHHPARLAKIGPDACVKCHEDEVADWKSSHHAKANRPVSLRLDLAAFTPARTIQESGVTYLLTETNGDFKMTVIHADGRELIYDLVGVIGETPLRQYLAHLPGNKFQTISASYDVINDRWFDVYEGQDRLPGEWGHWSGQGMNWNANCAYCHTTEYETGFDFERNAYDSTWLQQGIACAECHSGLSEHVEAAQAGNNTKGLTQLTKQQTEDNCATCHSRRGQLTQDAFEIGDRYEEHFELSLPDQPGLYYPDGKILDEVFVQGSFQMSRMAHAGVSCMDCHNPHTLTSTLPIENNMLCMRCHEAGGTLNAPIIQPEAHSFHAAGSTGNRCVECHMPQTNYMQVDPRADHGFHSPDPRMTQELGIPNACSNCHTDQSIDWAIEHAEAWYGQKLTNGRQRARAVADAYANNPAALPALLELAKHEDIPAWRSTYAGLMAYYLPEPTAIQHLQNLLNDESPLVRSRAVNGLAQTQQHKDRVLEKLGDDSRLVRLSAARAIAITGEALPESLAQQEWQQLQIQNIDRPQTLLLLANRAIQEKQPNLVQKYVTRALLLDSKNPEMYHQCAILLSSAGLNDLASRYLYTGWELAPDSPTFPYSLGLLAAETDDLDKAIGFLEETVSMEPRFYRAWYNLSLAYRKSGRNADADQALLKAQGQ
ncbi:MAG: Flp pilus assembly protein TadD [Lentimonas sp.]|jgi:Flp pilus assembly protein TadD